MMTLKYKNYLTVFVALIIVAAGVLYVWDHIVPAHAAIPKYEWVLIPSNTYPDITAKNNNCGSVVQDAWTCSRQSEGMVVRMYGQQQVGDKLGQGWNESFNEDKSVIRYKRYENCTKAGGANAGPGKRVYECKNTGSPEPSPTAPPDYSWVRIGKRGPFTPHMRGPYAAVNLKSYWPCDPGPVNTLICDASTVGKMAISEYKATGFIPFVDRGAYWQGWSAALQADTSKLNLSGFRESTCSGSPKFTQRLGAGYQGWEAYQCQSAIKNPVGFHDILDCNYVKGWTCDGDDYGQALQVHFYKDGPAGTGTIIGATTANTVRGQGVADACGGNPNHGFVFNTPEDFKDDTSHSVHAYAINVGTGNNVLLSSSPKNVTCASPPPTWGVTLSATPNSGIDPLSVALTAVGSGTATGGIEWQFDCDDGNGWQDPVINTNSTYSALCSLSPDGTYTAKVRSTREGLLREDTTTITVTIPPPPEVTITSHNFCTGGISGTITWDYTSYYTPVSDQTLYRLQVATDAGFTSISFDSTQMEYQDSNTVSVSGIAPGKQHYARAKAWDSNDPARVSAWSPTYPFRTPPRVSFTLVPPNPVANAPVSVTDTSNYGDAAPLLRVWDMGDGTMFGPVPPGQATESHIYGIEGSWTVNLQVTDSFLQKCDTSQDITIAKPIPGFKEVIPK